MMEPTLQLWDRFNMNFLIALILFSTNKRTDVYVNDKEPVGGSGAVFRWRQGRMTMTSCR
jgi:hypothetical protein